MRHSTVPASNTEQRVSLEFGDSEKQYPTHVWLRFLESSLEWQRGFTASATEQDLPLDASDDFVAGFLEEMRY